MKQLRSIEAIYKVLGGVEGVAAVTEAKPLQAAWWLRYSNQLPARTYVALTRALNRRGYEARASLWAMKGLNKRAA